MAITVTTSFSESNVSIQNNTSSLTVNIYFSPNNTQTWFQSATLYCRVNGTTQSKTVSLSKGGSVSTSFTFNNIAHNDDGTKSVEWSWSCSTGTSVLGDLYRSGTRVLTTIPRYSDITCSFPVDMGSTQSVGITQKSDTFSHILFYKTSIDSDYTEIGRGTATTTYSWTLPNIASQLPNVAFDNYTLLCRTYTNANYEGEPLESTLNVQANIPSSYVPTITIDNISEGNTNIPSGWPYVVGHSKLNVRTRFTGSANSTVVSRAVKVGNETITSDNSTPLVEMSFTQPLTATSNQVYASTVDSRGRTGSASQNVQAVAYASPTIAIDVTRCQQDGTIDAMGEYALVRAKWSWTDVNNLNSASIKINVDGSLKATYQTTTNSQTNWQQIAILSNILATNDYTIQAVIQDVLASSQVSQTVTKATLPFSLFDDGTDIGASFGRMATEPGWNFYDNDLTVSGGNAILEQLLNGTNYFKVLTTTTNANDLTTSGIYGIKFDGSSVNFPTSNSGVLFVVSTEHTGSLFQIFQSSWRGTYQRRRYSNGTWTDWVGANGIVLDGSNNYTISYLSNFKTALGWWQTLWTGELKGGNTLSLDMSAYSKIKVYAICFGGQSIFEMDLTKASPNVQVSGYSYQGQGFASWLSGSTLERYVCECLVSSNKQTFNNYLMGFTTGTNWNNRNNTGNYYVYKIEGLE